MVKTQIPPNKEHLAAIGSITACFALLDSNLSLCIWVLIDGGKEQEMGRIITTDLSFTQKIVLFRALYTYRNDSNERLIKLKELVKRFKQAEAERNTVMHSMWLAGKNSQTITRFKSTIKKKSGLKHTFEDMNVEAFEKIAESISQLAYDVINFPGIFKR